MKDSFLAFMTSGGTERKAEVKAAEREELNKLSQFSKMGSPLFPKRLKENAK